MAEIIRKLHAGDADALDALVSSGFSYPAGSGFLGDFPIWDPRIQVAQRISTGIFGADGQMLSHVGSRRWKYLLPPGAQAVTACTLGAIATDPSARGKGYATQLIRTAIQESEKQKDTFVILWGGEHEFYSQFGFELAGQQYLVDLALMDLKALTPNTADSVRSGFDDRIFVEFLGRRAGPEFLASDEAWLRAHQTVRWFTIDEPFAFVGVGRGQDLPGIVHEYGGDFAGVLTLFAWLNAKVPGIHLMGSSAECLRLGADLSDIEPQALALVRKNADMAWPEAAWISGLGSV